MTTAIGPEQPDQPPAVSMRVAHYVYLLTKARTAGSLDAGGVSVFAVGVVRSIVANTFTDAQDKVDAINALLIALTVVNEGPGGA